MGYTAIKKMQKQLMDKYGSDWGPSIPKLATKEKPGSLAWCALTFLRENCEGLRFSKIDGFDTEQLEAIQSCRDRLGRSYSENQIPYFMQLDIDRLCLEQTLGNFLSEGTTQAAYLVYFCYLEMFWSGSEASDVRKMIEELSEFEKNSSPLLSSHRDHFAHSVYVFAIGLAIFQQSPLFQQTYEECYHSELHGVPAAHHFLKNWGFTALFHDLGYPFELAFEQIQDYFKGQNTPAFHTCYRKGPVYLEGQAEENYEIFYQGLSPKHPSFSCKPPKTADELFATLLTERLYSEYHTSKDYNNSRVAAEDTPEAFFDYLLLNLQKKPAEPQHFYGHMDHAYFSAYLVLHHLGGPCCTTVSDSAKESMDALTAILLHNSLFKHSILKEDKGATSTLRMKMRTHPLAYLLMLCDDLQCWNRFGYGRLTRGENHPIDCKLSFSGDEIDAKYCFDIERINNQSGTISKFSKTSDPYLFLREIEDYLLINSKSSGLSLNVSMDLTDLPPINGEPLSECSFLNTFQLATLLNAEYQARIDYNENDSSRPHLRQDASEQERLESFNKLSLEYKLANFYQVQQFADHLSRIGCFFTDREVSFRELERFSANQLKEIGKWEHETWTKRKYAMGWHYGTHYLELESDNDEVFNLRECMREHQYLSIAFKKLPAEKKLKDITPIINYKYYMKKYYRVRIYTLR